MVCLNAHYNTLNNVIGAIKLIYKCFSSTFSSIFNEVQSKTITKRPTPTLNNALFS